MSSNFSENVGIEGDSNKEFQEVIIINFENAKNCSSLSGIDETGMEMFTSTNQARPWQMKRLKPSQNLLNFSQNQRIKREKNLSKIRNDASENFGTDIFQDDNIPTLISSNSLINLQEQHDYNRMITKHFLMMWFSFDSLAMSSALSTAVYNGTERALMERYFDPEISITSPQQSLHFSGPTTNASGIFTHQGLDAVSRHFEGVSVFRSSLGLHSIHPVEKFMLSVNIDMATFESVNDNIQCIFCVQTHNAMLCGGNLEFSFVGMVTGVFRESKLVSADIYFNAHEVQTKFERCFGASAAVLSRHLSIPIDAKDSSTKKSVSFVTKGAANIGDVSLSDELVSLPVFDNCSQEPSGAEAHKLSSSIQLRSDDITRKVLERTALLQPVAVTVRDARLWCQYSTHLTGGLFPHGAQDHEHESCLVEVYPQTDAVSGVLTSLLWRVTMLSEAETGCAMSADTLRKLMDKCVECMSHVSSAPQPVAYDPRCQSRDNHLKECESAAAVVRIQSSIASYQQEAKKLATERRSTVAVVNRVLNLVSDIDRHVTASCSCAASGNTAQTSKDFQIPSVAALITPGASKKSLSLLPVETETDYSQVISDGSAARRVRVVSESPLETHETILSSSDQAHREFKPPTLTQQEPSEYFYCDPASEEVTGAHAAQERRDESHATEIGETRNAEQSVFCALQQTVAEFFHAMRVSGLLVPLVKHMGALSAVANSAELVLLGRLVALTEGLHSDPQIRQWMQRAEAESTSREEAFQLLSDVQRKDKSFAEAFYRRAGLLHAIHFDAQSFADLHETLKLSPTHSGAMLGKAHLYFKTFDFRSALVMFSAAVAHNPALLTVSLQEAVNRCHTELNKGEDDDVFSL